MLASFCQHLPILQQNHVLHSLWIRTQGYLRYLMNVRIGIKALGSQPMDYRINNRALLAVGTLSPYMYILKD